MPTTETAEKRPPTGNMVHRWVPPTPISPAEMWAPIPRTRGYHASNLGRIANRKGKIMAQCVDKRGRRYVRIHGRNRKVAQVVLLAWTGSPSVEGYYTRRIKGDKSDNSLENLVWAGGAF